MARVSFIALRHETTQPRLLWPTVFTQMARVMAQMGTCEKRMVGAVIVSGRKQLLSAGYNGAPTGQPHCLEVGCLLDDSGRCVRAVHAEINAILNAAKHGASLQGSYMYCTDRPCLNCANAIVQAGIQGVFWWRDDLDSPTRPLVLELFERAGVRNGPSAV